MGNWQAWLWSAGLIVAAAIVAQVVHRVGFVLFDRLARHTTQTWDSAAVRRISGPARLALTLFAILFVMPDAPMSDAVRTTIDHAIAVGLIGAVAWSVIATVSVLEDVLREKFRTDVPDNLKARRIATQTQVLRRVVAVVVSIVAVSVALMTFPTIRHIGASLLASAGLAGLVVGMAMRPTLSNLLAGVQIALTQPIRLEDAVIVEGEWGWIEEIGTTYVVVKIWDLRRLVLPLSYFVEKPFQNWTRTTAMLLGSVYLYVDYTVSVDDLRAELRRILESTPLWLGEVCVLQVSDAREHTIELRALADAKDSGTAWDLRCLIREKLIAYLQQRSPGSLPRARVVLDSRASVPAPLAQREPGLRPA
ncbi:MAG TPA: mechanosensitive ion channel domain-containing protein [Burkholderiaceae bacterium]|nr:mechanosensitive ion channel domain-containing protein [Burkholderiaceae bacterium]